MGTPRGPHLHGSLPPGVVGDAVFPTSASFLSTSTSPSADKSAFRGPLILALAGVLRRQHAARDPRHVRAALCKSRASLSRAQQLLVLLSRLALYKLYAIARVLDEGRAPLPLSLRSSARALGGDPMARREGLPAARACAAPMRTVFVTTSALVAKLPPPTRRRRSSSCSRARAAAASRARHAHRAPRRG